MRAMYKIIGIACAFIAATACGAGAPRTLLERLARENLPLWQSTAAAIVDDRQTDIKILIDLAGREPQGRRFKSGGQEYVEYPPQDTKHLAMLLLGDLRAPEGVSVLLRDIEYRVPKTPSRGYELGLIEGPGWHPAVESLIKISMPSVGPVIGKLGGCADNSLGRRLCLVVLKDILGPRLAKARLEIGVEEAKDETARANLKAALEQFESQLKTNR